MRLRDFSIILILVGVAASIFVTMMTDPNLETHYGTGTAHAEDNFSSISDKIIEASETNRNRSAELQNQLIAESDVSLFSLGSNTFEVVKSALSFEYLDAVNDIFFALETQYGLPAEIGASLFAVLVLIIVFTVVGAFLRWRS